MSRIYLAKGDLEGAIAALERAAEADPDDEFYRRAIQQLRGLQKRSRAIMDQSGDPRDAD